MVNHSVPFDGLFPVVLLLDFRSLLSSPLIFSPTTLLLEACGSDVLGFLFTSLCVLECNKGMVMLFLPRFICFFFFCNNGGGFPTSGVGYVFCLVECFSDSVDYLVKLEYYLCGDVDVPSEWELVFCPSNARKFILMGEVFSNRALDVLDVSVPRLSPVLKPHVYVQFSV